MECLFPFLVIQSFFLVSAGDWFQDTPTRRRPKSTDARLLWLVLHICWFQTRKCRTQVYRGLTVLLSWNLWEPDPGWVVKFKHSLGWPRVLPVGIDLCVLPNTSEICHVFLKMDWGLRYWPKWSNSTKIYLSDGYTENRTKDTEVGYIT